MNFVRFPYYKTKLDIGNHRQKNIKNIKRMRKVLVDWLLKIVLPIFLETCTVKNLRRLALLLNESHPCLINCKRLNKLII